MPARKRPRRGSKAYWPRKRTRRIYPRIKAYPKVEKAKPLAFAAYKAGMLQAVIVDNKKGSPTFGEEIVVPVTILDSPSLYVAGIRAYMASPKGLRVLSEVWSDKVPKELARKTKAKIKKGTKEIESNIDKIETVRLIVATQPKLAGFGKKKPELLEIEIGGSDVKEKVKFAKEKLGKELAASDVMQEGELVDAIAISKGKGVAGPVKRFGIKIQTRHAKGKRRHTGSLGQERPGKVRPSVPQAGQMGKQRRTEISKRVLKIGEGKDITPKAGFNRYGVIKSRCIVLEGSIPGPKKRLIVLRHAMRARKPRVTVEVKKIVKE